MTTTNVYQGINPGESKTSSKVLAPPGGKTSVNLFGAEPAEHQPVQRGAKHPDRNASNVCFEAPEKQASRSSANKPADNSANNLFGPPPKRDVPKPKADSHNTLFGPAEPPAPKAVQTGNPVTGEGVASYDVTTEFRSERTRSTGTQWSPQKASATERDPVSGTGMPVERTPRPRSANFPEKHLVPTERDIVKGTGMHDEVPLFQRRTPSPRKGMYERDVCTGVGMDEENMFGKPRLNMPRSPSPRKGIDERNVTVGRGVETQKMFARRSSPSPSPRKAASQRDITKNIGVQDCTRMTKRSPSPSLRRSLELAGDPKMFSSKGGKDASPKGGNPLMAGSDPRSRTFAFDLRGSHATRRKDVNPITGEGVPNVDYLNEAVRKVAMSPRTRNEYEKGKRALSSSASTGAFGSDIGEKRSTKVMAPPGGKSQISFG